jgi:uncharacterized protein
MTPPLHDSPLSAEELDGFEKLLASDVFHGDAMSLDAVQGLFFAIACAPDPVAPERFMPVVLGETPRFERPEQEIEFRDLVMRFFRQCIHAVESEEFTLLLYEGEKGKDDLETWCAGYLEGVDLCTPGWYEAGAPEDVDELLFPFVVLAGDLSEQERRQFKAADWRDLVQSCEESIGDAIVEAREYWKILRNPPPQVRRDVPKTGRNDPCPCGSGKKYKQCCGGAARS